MLRRNRSMPIMRFAVVLALATAVTTGIAGRPDAPGKGHAKVLPAKALLSDATPPGYDTVQDVDGAEMVGLTYSVPPGEPDPTIQVRGLRGGQWTEWLDLSADNEDGPDADSPEYHPGRRSTSPAWLGHDQEQVEVRVTSGTAAGLELHAVDSEAPEASGDALGLPAAEAAEASVAAPAAVTPAPAPRIYGRVQWGADEAGSYSQPGCESGPGYASALTNAIVHHTVSANTYTPQDTPAMLRGIQAYHIYANGWCDIGYNFLVDAYGQIFEGRRGGIGYAVIGAHASGFNTGSTGIAMVGDYSSSGLPNPAYDSLVDLLTWKLSYHQLPGTGTFSKTVGANEGAYWPEGTVIALERITGHRDVNATACPGYVWSLLSRLRADVGARIAALPRLVTLEAWYLRTTPSTGAPNTVFAYGNPGDIPIMCDWFGIGQATPGVVRGNRWILSRSPTGQSVDAAFYFGTAGDTPLCGDWDGNGTETPAVWRSGTFYFSNTFGNVSWVVGFGSATDIPIVGRWDGGRYDLVGVDRGGAFYLSPSNLFPRVGWAFLYGNPGDVPLVGDWDGNGTETVGIKRGASYYLADNPASGQPNRWFVYGDPTDVGLAGRFAPGTVTGIGVARAI